MASPLGDVGGTSSWRPLSPVTSAERPAPLGAAIMIGRRENQPLLGSRPSTCSYKKPLACALAALALVGIAVGGLYWVAPQLFH